MRNAVHFLLGERARALSDVDPSMTVLEYLRTVEHRCGTKEGCAEGDCGACTVVLGEPDGNGGISYKAVNSCIQTVPVLDGKQLITVEDLRGDDGALHPVQEAMCNEHASQCGFCTPGFVMALFAEWRNGMNGSRQGLKDALAGNLCRCTGYGPILAAGEALQRAPDKFDDAAKATAKALRELDDGETVLLEHEGKRCFIPRNADELAEVYGANPDATIIAGLTDVGLWITKLHRQLDTFIYLGDVGGLKAIKETPEGLRIFAAATLADAHPSLARLAPAMDGLMARFAGGQIRPAGTVCGNIANGSPIGDLPPCLIAFDARLTLRKGSERREIALEDFFIDYGKQDRAKGEFVESVFVPRPADGEAFFCHKISKRFDQDISAVMAAMKLREDGGKVKDIRICYGGMAGVPKRAANAEATLLGSPFDEKHVRAAMAAMEDDFTPLTDMRSSAAYRMAAAQNVLMRFLLESDGGEGTVDVRVVAHG
ncbi:MAG: xanthine dehydrogenase small subunit [Hyphomicrobiales bacterium]